MKNEKLKSADVITKRCALISTGHLSAAEREYLMNVAARQAASSDPCSDQDVFKYSCGWLVRLIGEIYPDWVAEMPSFRKWVDWAQQHDFQMLQFDADGDVVDAWPVYE